MIPHDYVHRPHSSVDFRMATPRKQPGGFKRLLKSAAEVLTFILIVLACIVGTWMISPEDKPDPSVSYLPQGKS